MTSYNTNDPDFKAAFAAAAATGNTVMEGGTMEDYFHISSLEMHQHLANWGEFAVRSANAEDLVGLEEVTRNMRNQQDLLTVALKRMDTLRKAVETSVSAKKALKDAKAQVKMRSDCVIELFEEELGMSIEIE